jgi:hypothetical protein
VTLKLSLKKAVSLKKQKKKDDLEIKFKNGCFIGEKKVTLKLSLKKAVS